MICRSSSGLTAATVSTPTIARNVTVFTRCGVDLAG